MHFFIVKILLIELSYAQNCILTIKNIFHIMKYILMTRTGDETKYG